MMKKNKTILAFVLALSMCASLASCGDSAEIDNAEETTAKTTTAAGEEEPEETTTTAPEADEPTFEEPPEPDTSFTQVVSSGEQVTISTLKKFVPDMYGLSHEKAAAGF